MPSAKHLVGSLALAAVTLAGCVDDPVEPSLEPSAEPSESGAAGPISSDVEWLPVGMSVPPGVAVRRPPRPLHLSGERARPNSVPELNLVQYPDSVYPVPPRRSPGAARRGEGGLGPKSAKLEIYSTEAGWDLYAGGFSLWSENEISLDIEMLPQEESTYLYAPTHWPYGESCLEVTFAHYRSEWRPIRHEFWVWDHCNGQQDGRVLIENMENFGWQNAYARVVRSAGELSAIVDIREGYCPPPEEGGWDDCQPGCTRVVIYNWQRGWWDTKWRTCDSTFTTHRGWTMWEYETESYSIRNACYSKPGVSAPMVYVWPGPGQSSRLLDELYYSGDADPWYAGPCFAPDGPFTMRLWDAGWNALTPAP